MPEGVLGYLGDRQITHLIGVRLTYLLNDFLGGGGCFGPLSCCFSYRKGPKHPLKRSYSKCLSGHRLDEQSGGRLVFLPLLNPRMQLFAYTVGSFLLTVELFYLQWTILALLLTIGALLLTVLAFLLAIGAFFAYSGKVCLTRA